MRSGLEAVIFVEDAVEENVVGGGAAGRMGMVGCGGGCKGGGLWVRGVGLARSGGESGGCVLIVVCGCGERFALEGFVGGRVGGCCWLRFGGLGGAGRATDGRGGEEGVFFVGRVGAVVGGGLGGLGGGVVGGG